MQLTTRKIVTAGVLLAVALILAFTGLGYIPVPNLSGAATIMAVPVIIGAVLEGPVVGVIVSLVFAIDAYIRFAGIFTGAPAYVPIVILLIPRLFVGVGAWLGYRALKGKNEIMALVVAGLGGSLTNTVLVIGLGLILLPVLAALPSFTGVTAWLFVLSIVPQALVEAVLAAIITVAVVVAWKRLDKGAGKSSV